MFGKSEKKHKESKELAPIYINLKNNDVQHYLPNDENVKKHKKSKHKEHHKKHGKKHKKHKHKHSKKENLPVPVAQLVPESLPEPVPVAELVPDVEPAPEQAPVQIEEKPCEPTVQSSMWWNYDQTLLSGYSFGNADLNFNLGGNGPMRINQPIRQFSTFIIPKLRNKQQQCMNLNTPSEVFTTQHSPARDLDWLHDQNFRPISPIKKSDIDHLPTSEDIWLSYEASKQGAEPEWPICCTQNAFSPMPAPKARPVKSKTVESTQTSQFNDLDEVIASLANWDSSCERREEFDQQTQQDAASVSFVELDSLDLSLDEERGLVDFLKSKRLHTPLSDIKAFEMLLNMARSEENRKALQDLLRPKMLVQVRPGKGMHKAPSREGQDTPMELELVKERTVIETTQQRVAERVELSNMAPHVIKTEDMQKAIDSIIVIDQPQEQHQQQKQKLDINTDDQPENDPRPDQPLIANVEKLPQLVATPKPQEDAVQLWLQQLGQDLSRVVQSRLDSLPIRVPERLPNAAHIEPIDFEAQISETAQMQPKIKTSTGEGLRLESELKITAVIPQSPGQWENSYKRRLDDFDDIIDQNMTEFRDPQGKRLRASRWLNDAGKRNLDSLKRVLEMPALPTHLDQGLQQLRILRPPTKRKIERTKMPVEMKLVRAYSTLEVNCNLDMNQLALELDNAVYNSDIQVLQMSYDAAQMAWIWDNGSILISNARSKAILVDTQKCILSKILGDAATVNMAQHNALHSQMIHIAQFPWHICIEEFSQTYSLSSDTVQDSLRYAYYVNKNIPSVAAKVYESGAIHVFAMTAVQADNMLEKLFLLTANHRKSKAIIPPKQKSECNGTFIPLFPT
ncbi:uncharacterized protein LOC115769333 [Drosophila novamexicana]|uniref:uncharacterized protein LOC115769333 n=1 Tax=Drosophila novamexicana TaxID=47314 RepID=UPI0011E5E4BD|nr:uncharacterized protein LOC115769333 [Drosophila novamexicana]